MASQASTTTTVDRLLYTTTETTTPDLLSQTCVSSIHTDAFTITSLIMAEFPTLLAGSSYTPSRSSRLHSSQRDDGSDPRDLAASTPSGLVTHAFTHHLTTSSSPVFLPVKSVVHLVEKPGLVESTGETATGSG